MKRIGLLLANLNLGLSVPIWKSVADEADEADDGPLFLFPGGRLDDRESNEYMANSIYSLANGKSLDGLVIWSSSLGGLVSSEDVARFVQGKASELPVVSIGLKAEGVPSVDFDAYSGMKAEMLHLIHEHGERSIAFLRGPELHKSAEARYQAYKDALKESRIAFDPGIVSSPVAWDRGYEAMEELVKARKLRPGRDFTAVVAASDQLLSKAARLLGELELRVPEDIALAGFNDSKDDLVTLGARITTVRLPVRQLAKAAYSSISDPANAHDTMLPTHLVVRESCGCSGSFENVKTKEAFRQELRQLLPSDSACALAFKVLVVLARGDKARLEAALEAYVAEGADFDVLIDAIPVYSRVEGRPIEPSALDAFYRTLMRVEERNAARERLASLARLRLLNDFKTELVSAHTLEQAVSVMAADLPKVGVGKCFLFLYEGFSEVVFKGGFSGSVLYPGGERFRRGLIAPETLGEELRAGTFVVEPLYQGTEELGYLVMSAKGMEGHLLEDIRTVVSYAVKGARLFEENSKAKEAAERKKREAWDFYGKLSEGVMQPLRDISTLLSDGGDVDTKTLKDHALSAEQIIALSFAEHIEQDVTKRLWPAGELILRLREKGLKAEAPDETPALSIDLEKLADAISSAAAVLFPAGDAVITAKLSKEGFEIDITGEYPVKAGADMLLVPRKVVLLNSGTFMLSESGLVITLPYPTLSGGTGFLPPAGAICYLRSGEGDKVPASLEPLSPEVEGKLDFTALSLSPPVALSWRGGRQVPVKLLRSHRATRDLPFLIFGLAKEDRDLFSVSSLSDSIAVCAFCEIPEELSVLGEFGLLVRASALRDLERLSSEPALFLFDRVDPRLFSGIRERRRFGKVPFLVVSESFTAQDAEALSMIPNLLMANSSILEAPAFQSRLVRVIGGEALLPALTGALVKKAIAYINANARNSVSRWKLADAVNISEDYLTRIFHKETGLSPWEYLSRYRIQLASELLTRTGLSISEIASSIGFQDQAYFCRVFKKIKGFPPGKLRQRKGEG